MLTATTVGWRAHAALGASGGGVRVIASLSRSVYADAAGELVWIGNRSATLHPRVVLVDTVPDVAIGTRLRLDAAHAVPWRAPRFAPRTPAHGTVRHVGAALLHRRAPRGLARILAASGDDTVTRVARSHVDALARACAGDDAVAFVHAARPLLGLGEGLTPSGDDLVGGALCARRLLFARDAGWDDAAATVAAAAAGLTHPISARLLGDLCAGDAWAPLHDLLAALAADDVGRALEAADRLTALGHSSGWDLLAGVLIAVGAASVAPESAGATS